MHRVRSERNAQDQSQHDLLSVRAFAAIVDSSDDAILSKNLDGIILSWNRGAEGLYGYTPEEVIGRPVNMLVPDEAPEEIPSIMAKLKRGERIRHFETRRRKKDGTIIDVSLTISPVYDDAGTIIGASAIARDITQAKRFREFRNFLASIVDSSEDAIFSKDLNGYILTWNKGAEKLYGYSEKEMLGKHVSVLTPSEKSDEISTIMDRLRKGKRIEHYETVRIRKDGTRLAISLTVSPIKDANGKVIGASSIGRDITMRTRAEEEKAALIKELKDSIAQKDVLLQEVYHRVKNNLQVVSSLLELRSRYLTDDSLQAKAAFRESIGRIRSMALVHEKLYKTENLHQLDFNSYLRSLTRQLLHSYNLENRIEIVIQGDTSNFGLNRAISLGLIFTELITNSFKYAFDGLPKGKITIDFSVKKKHTKILICDDGKGLPEGLVFEEADSFGFRIVKLLARQMKAEIKQVKRPKGTGFRLNIPFLEQGEERHAF
jgi:PAS domain S-box-containing protein